MEEHEFLLAIVAFPYYILREEAQVMEAIRKHIVVDSDTISIPELERFKGKRMELILIQEDGITRGNGEMRRFLEAAGKVDIDENAIMKLREESKL